MKMIVAVLALVATVLTLDAQAQSTPPVLRIGWLSPAAAGSGTPNLDALLQGLGDLGYTEGRNLKIEARWAGDATDKLPALAHGLVAQSDCVICTSGRRVACVARGAP